MLALLRFIYVGTTEGQVHVLECLSGTIRECDYTVSLADAGITGALLPFNYY
jgi:hypothetical protein